MKIGSANSEDLTLAMRTRNNTKFAQVLLLLTAAVVCGLVIRLNSSAPARMLPVNLQTSERQQQERQPLPQTQQPPLRTREPPPETRQSPPETRQSSPETRQSPPETRQSPPETRQSSPETRQPPPETRQLPPETRQPPPETRQLPPETRQSPPETRQSPPETRHSPSESRQSPPETRQPPPETRHPPPETRQSPPEMRSLPTESRSLPLDTGPLASETAPPPSETSTAARPDERTTQGGEKTTPPRDPTSEGPRGVENGGRAAQVRVAPPAGQGDRAADDCPPGPFLTIRPTGRLGNKLCQFLTLTVVARGIPGAQARLQPEMAAELGAHFAGRHEMAPLSAACSAAIPWSKVHMKDEATFAARLATGESLWIDQHPCPLSRFYAVRAELLPALVFREDLARGAREQLARAPEGTRTFIGVHVRRTDYAVWLSKHLDGHLVSERYLRCALRHARRTYPRPAFIVASDDMAWCRAHLRGADLVFAGSDSAAGDLAALAACNHSIVTYGTFGYMSAFLAGGDVVAPSGFAGREYPLVREMRKAPRNFSQLADSDDC